MNQQQTARQDIEKRNNEAERFACANVQRMHHTWEFSALLDSLFHKWSKYVQLAENADYKNEFLNEQTAKSLAEYEETKRVIVGLQPQKRGLWGGTWEQWERDMNFLLFEDDSNNSLTRGL